METLAPPLRADAACLNRLLEDIHGRVGTQKFNVWFRHGTSISLEEDMVRIGVPNAFVGNWIETHFQADIAAATQQALGRSLPCLITIDATLSSHLRQRQLDTQAQQVARASEGRLPAPAAPSAQQFAHRLDDFVVGESNRLAYSAAMAVATAGKAPFNPLFIHGPCGVGKTHLLQGVCSAMAKLGQQGKAVAWRYVTGEQFTNEFVAALRAKKLDEFRARYRKLDLLAIDDVHFLANKKATQEEFLHTFNTLQSAGNQIIMASDAHPKLVGELNAQLLSRFVAGMVVKIEAPDQATRLEVLRRRASRTKLPVPDDVLTYIAAHIRGSVRELEGAVVKLTALAALEGGKVTLQLANEALADHLARTESVVTLSDIEAVVAAYFGITPADIHSSRRTKTVSVARMLAMFLARRHTRMSYPEIGRFMGKNHSSAVLAVQRMEALLAQEGDLEWSGPMGQRTMPARKLMETLSAQIG